MISQIQKNKNLVLAAKNSDAVQIKKLLSQGASPDYREQMALQEAVFEGDLEGVQLLVEAYGQIHPSTPFFHGGVLFMAAEQGLLPVLTYLIERMQQDQCIDDDLSEALIRAVTGSQISAVELILQKGGIVTVWALTRGAHQKNQPMAELLLRNGGADILLHPQQASIPPDLLGWLEAVHLKQTTPRPLEGLKKQRL